ADMSGDCDVRLWIVSVEQEQYRGVFFFQAEDGIRDRNVTGVQTVLFRSSATKSRNSSERYASATALAHSESTCSSVVTACKIRSSVRSSCSRAKAGSTWEEYAMEPGIMPQSKSPSARGIVAESMGWMSKLCGFSSMSDGVSKFGSASSLTVIQPSLMSKRNARVWLEPSAGIPTVWPSATSSTDLRSLE